VEVAEPDREPVVVVAEDSAVVRAVLSDHLTERGFRVVEAQDGLAALAACREAHPDVVLLDVEMPELDGHQVLAALQADVPVVFLTGRDTTEDLVEGLRLGAHDYLRKPFEEAELIARVSAALRVKRLTDELRERNEQLDRVARVDELTGLANRRHLQEHLAGVAAGAARHGRPYAVLVLDIDHFKVVNDRHGHHVGDQALRAMAGCLLSTVRAADSRGGGAARSSSWWPPTRTPRGRRSWRSGSGRRCSTWSCHCPTGRSCP
jgi:two-component system, cell cycle response regulator